MWKLILKGIVALSRNAAVRAWVVEKAEHVLVELYDRYKPAADHGKEDA